MRVSHQVWDYMQLHVFMLLNSKQTFKNPRPNTTTKLTLWSYKKTNSNILIVDHYGFRYVMFFWSKTSKLHNQFSW